MVEHLVTNAEQHSTSKLSYSGTVHFDRLPPAERSVWGSYYAGLVERELADHLINLKTPH